MGHFLLTCLCHLVSLSGTNVQNIKQSHKTIKVCILYKNQPPQPTDGQKTAANTLISAATALIETPPSVSINSAGDRRRVIKCADS